MNSRIHEKLKRGFTIPEVIMAVGIVAFGLVGVFSILPFGLTVQKDNREETIIAFEANYWDAVLQSGGFLLEEMDRVETVELYTGPTDPLSSYDPAFVFRINRYDLPEAAKAGWPVDVCGWLSAPDYILNNGDEIKRVPAKFARVWAVNGPLFDRLHSPPSIIEPPVPGGEFSFSYFLETSVKPETDSTCLISLTFHWPISGPIQEALDSGHSMYSIVNGLVPNLRPPANKRALPLRYHIPHIARPMRPIPGLDARQKQFLRAGLPGDEVSIPDLKAHFKTRDSHDLSDEHKRELTISVAAADPKLGRATVWVDVGTNVWINVGTTKVKKWIEKWRTWPQLVDNNNSRRLNLSEAFSENDIGWYINIKDSGVQKTYRIVGVEPVLGVKNIKNGHTIWLKNSYNINGEINEDVNAPFIPPEDSGRLPYTVTFLNKDPDTSEVEWEKEEWEKQLGKWVEDGLLEKLPVDEFSATSANEFSSLGTVHARWRFGFIHNSKAWELGFPKNTDGVRFSVPLEAVDYLPDKPFYFPDLAPVPPDDTNCSFWFLRKK